jgi:hypothetical protein
VDSRQGQKRTRAETMDGIGSRCLRCRVPIWRGSERGHERGLSWTTDRAVAEKFARGMRCVNKYPRLVSAEIPKQHIFAVYQSREESELVVDPGRLRKLHAQPYGAAAFGPRDGLRKTQSPARAMGSAEPTATADSRRGSVRLTGASAIQSPWRGRW